MTISNPNLLYVLREVTPPNFNHYIYSGHTWAWYDEVKNLVRGEVEVVDAHFGPVGSVIIEFDSLVPVSPLEGPSRPITFQDHERLSKKYIHEVAYTDLWFTQQTDLKMILAYQQGYDAHAKGQEFAIKPGSPDDNLLCFAWNRGWSRRVYLEHLQATRDAWKNP